MLHVRRPGFRVRTGAAAVAAASVLLGPLAAVADIIDSSTPTTGLARTTLRGEAGAQADSDRWFSVDADDLSDPADHRDGAVYTRWSNESISFVFSDIAAEQEEWFLGIEARNIDGPLKEGYDTFKVDVRLDGTKVGRMDVGASDDEWITSWAGISGEDLAAARAGDAGDPLTVTLQWKNDSWKRGRWDANFGIATVTLASAEVPAPASFAIVGLGGWLVSRPRRRRPSLR